MIASELNITCIQGPRVGARVNVEFLQELSRNRNFELVHLMLDDDVIFPNFYQIHLLNFSLHNPSCSVSLRAYSTEDKVPFRLGRVPEQIRNDPRRFLKIERDYLLGSTVPVANNWLGEFSHAVFEYRFFSIRQNILEFKSYPNSGLEDLVSFLNASNHNGLCFINESLGFFRQSGANNTLKRDFNYACSILCWPVIGAICCSEGKISPESFRGLVEFSSNLYSKNYDNQKLILFLQEIRDLIVKADTEAAIRKILEFWKGFLAAATQSYSPT